jgi:NADH:ubiquinone oxidoreductase subunit
MSFIKRIFTWWNGSTFGTSLMIGRRGVKIGEDAFGNTYYEEKKETYDGRKRRWVTYDGYADASRVPPGWQGWLNHTSELPPTEDGYVPHYWEEEHIPNLTGTVHAYKPKGSLDRGGVRDKVAADYEAWSPDA